MMQHKTYFMTTFLLLTASIVSAAEWGDLTVQFVYDGTPPAPVKATVNKDVAYCGKFNVLDESVVVNPKNGGVANVIAHIYVGRGDSVPAVHPDYEKTAANEVKLDNKQCRFEPHVTLLRTSQTLLVGNSDEVGHNTNITALSNTASNVLVPAGGELKQKFPLAERFPMQVACNIHPWMQALVVVQEHPYMAASDADGKLTIKNLPAGKLTFQFRHERPGYLTEVTLDGKKTSWRRGRVELTIKPGQNDLGVVKLAPSVFEEK